MIGRSPEFVEISRPRRRRSPGGGQRARLGTHVLAPASRRCQRAAGTEAGCRQREPGVPDESARAVQLVRGLPLIGVEQQLDDLDDALGLLDVSSPGPLVDPRAAGSTRASRCRASAPAGGRCRARAGALQGAVAMPAQQPAEAPLDRPADVRRRPVLKDPSSRSAPSVSTAGPARVAGRARPSPERAVALVEAVGVEGEDAPDAVVGPRGLFELVRERFDVAVGGRASSAPASAPTASAWPSTARTIRRRTPSDNHPPPERFSTSAPSATVSGGTSSIRAAVPSKRSRSAKTNRLVRTASEPWSIRHRPVRTVRRTPPSRRRGGPAGTLLHALEAVEYEDHRGRHGEPQDAIGESLAEDRHV